MDEPVMMSDRKGHNGITEDGTATTLTAQEKDRPMVETSIVRRLTPKECERLQGMPDDWSRWGVNDKGEVYELPDSARYKLQGNGIATPFWRWLMRRISAQYVGTPTLGSLFDGQGSFPMIWEGINGPGSAVWSSEIEKHAIAVCKYHFPEGRDAEEDGEDLGAVQGRALRASLREQDAILYRLLPLLGQERMSAMFRLSKPKAERAEEIDARRDRAWME